MNYELLKIVHLIAVVVWVGGMAFAHFFLRPALEILDPPLRLRLMREVLRRFLAAVTVAVALTLVSGAAMIDQVAAQAKATGGQLAMPLAWTAMTVLGLVMTAIFAIVRLRFFSALVRALDDDKLPAAATAMAQIRRWVMVNLVLGVAVIVIALARATIAQLGS